MASEYLKAHLIPFNNNLATWTSTNPIIQANEIVIENGSPMKAKIGNGSDHYLDLPYIPWSSGSGDYLGLATTATIPPVLGANAFYLSTDHGTFTNLGGIVIPSTALFSVITYDFASTTWSFSEILDSATLTTPNIDQVLTVGDVANGKVLNFKNGGGLSVVYIDGSGVGFISVDNGTQTIQLIGTGITGFLDSGAVQFALTDISGTALLALKDPVSAFYSTIKSGSLSANASYSTPPATGSVNLVADITTQTLTNKRDVVRYIPISSSATPGTSLNTDITDTFAITSQSGNITNFSTGMTGTPFVDDQLHIIIKTVGSITISWGSLFESSSVTLPTSITGSTRVDYFFIYNIVSTRWRLVSFF